MRRLFGSFLVLQDRPTGTTPMAGGQSLRLLAQAYQAKKGEWQLFDLSKDLEENNNLSKSQPDILNQLIAIAKSSHRPIRPGKIFNRELIDKDRKQAPHGKKSKKK